MKTSNINVSYVYFIKSGNNSIYKIGKSYNPISRTRNLQTGNHSRLMLYKCLLCPSDAMSLQVETMLHEFYATTCIGGEWFQISRKEIDMICEKYQYIMQNEIPIESFPILLAVADWNLDVQPMNSKKLKQVTLNSDPLYISVT